MSVNIYFPNIFKAIAGNNLTIRWIVLSLLIFTIFMISNKAHAACTISGTTNSSYNYTATTINSDATINYTGTITCTDNSNNIGTSKYMCMKAVFTGTTTANNSVSMPYTITGTISGAGNTTNLTSNTWYGPSTTVTNTNKSINYSISIKVPARTGTLFAYPKGTYVGNVQLYWDMQANSSSVCEGNSGGGWDSGNATLTANYIVPSLCQLNSTSNVDFGNIADIGITQKDYLAQGAISTTCNVSMPYSIYLGDGNNRVSGGFRRMVNTNSEYIPYQLYKDSSYSMVWENTGSSTVGGAGGVNLTGTGNAQNTPVYGKIPKGTNIASRSGNYTDSVVVTITY